MLLSSGDEEETFARVAEWDHELSEELVRGRSADLGKPRVHPLEVRSLAEDAERARLDAPLVGRITATDPETAARTQRWDSILSDGVALTGLLGKDLDDADLGAVLCAFGVADRIGSSDITAAAYGVALGFRLAPNPSSPGMLVLGQIAFRGEPTERAPAYAGRPPRGFQLDDTREAIQQRLGAPSWTNPYRAMDRWDDASTTVTVTFRKQGPGIQSITCARRG
jgi:hypothetical protein